MRTTVEVNRQSKLHTAVVGDRNVHNTQLVSGETKRGDEVLSMAFLMCWPRNMMFQMKRLSQSCYTIITNKRKIHIEKVLLHEQPLEMVSYSDI